MNVLSIDIGGSHIKFRSQKQSEVVKIDSGLKMTSEKMMQAVQEATAGWKYDRVSIGYPGPVIRDVPLREPHNLGEGWKRFGFADASDGKPVRVVNDAAMQALGSYKQGRMLFLGLGTGLGSAMVIDNVIMAMELAYLPWKKGRTYEDYLGKSGYDRFGKKTWAKNVFQVVESLQDAFQSEYTVLGGGNAKLLPELPKNVMIGHNENAFKGGFLLWNKAHKISL